ncbi:cytochrome P450 [Agrocybe pediades]|nr:cytochrome P450 [Agrocybe pediades]
MLYRPDVQKKAQAELDRVLGGRLPEPNDEPDLPYVTAIVLELLRWRPITPLALPHATTEDDVYRGYFIPKGSIVMPNSWSLLQDEHHYPEPDLYNPDRFMRDGKLNPEIRDPTQIVFGYGRRVCPGSHVALSFLWLTAATILSTFDISAGVDEQGQTIEPHVEYHTGVVSRGVDQGSRDQFRRVRTPFNTF